MSVSRQQECSQGRDGSGRASAKLPLLGRLEHHIWARVLSGFLLLVPALITYLILRFVFEYVDGLFRPLLRDTPLDILGIGVVITLLMFYVIGAFFAGQRFQTWQDMVLNRIPVVRSIYGVARQATAAFSSPMSRHFIRVVFVEWPRPGVRAMGFVTGHLSDAEHDGHPLVAVYIPTVPNPTSGMLAFLAEDDIIETNITVEDAMKTVFSGGIVLPDMSGHRAVGSLPSADEG